MPNFLLDEVMPRLSDTQWRLLCVIVRQTLGWQAEGKSVKRKPGQQNNPRKERDWLSHAQFKARTGRQSAAVCAAIEELVQQKLIEVQDAQGRSLATPQERRRVHSRLFYRLHPRIKQGFAREASNAEKEGNLSQSETVHNSKSVLNKAMISQSEFHKAKTTKENGTKEFLKNNLLSFTENEKPLPESSPNRERSSNTQNLPTNSDAESDGEISIDSFIGQYQSLYWHYRPGQSVPAISINDKELLKRRLRQHSHEVLEKWLPLFFASSFGYVRRRNYSLESFLNSWHVLQAARRNY